MDLLNVLDDLCSECIVDGMIGLLNAKGFLKIWLVIGIIGTNSRLIEWDWNMKWDWIEKVQCQLMDLIRSVSQSGSRSLSEWLFELGASHQRKSEQRERETVLTQCMDSEVLLLACTDYWAWLASANTLSDQLTSISLRKPRLLWHTHHRCINLKEVPTITLFQYIWYSHWSSIDPWYFYLKNKQTSPNDSTRPICLLLLTKATPSSFGLSVLWFVSGMFCTLLLCPSTDKQTENITFFSFLIAVPNIPVEEKAVITLRILPIQFN